MANNNKHTGPNVPALRFPEFSGEWETKTMLEIAPLQRGFDLPKGNIRPGDIPVVYSNGIMSTHNQSKCIGPGVITGRSGTIGSFTFIPNGPYWPHNTALWVTNFCGNVPLFIYHLYSHIGIVRFASGSGVPTLNRNDVHKHITSIPSNLREQNKIASFLSLLDDRIETQSKIIEELTTLRSALLEKIFQVSNPTLEVGAIAHQTSERNKLCRYSNVLSVSNRFGFINQSEQFEDRNVASDDVRNYKVVHRGDFAYNPARINVGSIAMLKSFESGIVSPMYICFQVDDTIVDPSFFELFLETKAFKDEMEIRLEGSVRRCLSFEALCEIHLPRPALLVQRSISNKIGNISAKIKLEDRILRAYIRQKEWLLKQMFI